MISYEYGFHTTSTAPPRSLGRPRLLRAEAFQSEGLKCWTLWGQAETCQEGRRFKGRRQHDGDRKIYPAW